MAVLGMIQKYGPAIKDNRLPFAIAPAGASAVLIYGVPSAPLSQPRNVLVGHMIAAVTGICMNELFKHAPVSLQWLPGALAVGLSIALMGITNCYHPPAGATAYLAGYYSPDAQRVGWWFPLFPVLPVVLIMVSIGVLLNNLARIYPVYWFTAVHSTPPKPLHEPKVDVTQGTEPSRDNDSGSKPLRPLSSSSESGSECAVERASYVDDRIENEGDADYAWMAARISELEHELHELRAKQRQNEESHSPSCQPGHV
ncbi:hypothetical protein GGI04_003496 [Coemansia thaxteri]|uniref:HPP transmembrane region domain-containing protein n=1 Tax=Coemansia thaxteri TaxID=2663907 RepID=A0A9W8BKM4_9FUNG|nr:hypothetical protein GGI04_003496 [Coemansia thaxteri]KAJ2004243.1 hypothetical protein H4R26_002622 [Coemansia thaxteri]KAJ2472400.1 hypothetical protein GGI02_001602 [Coemansia sp. RSA 2322]